MHKRGAICAALLLFVLSFFSSALAQGGEDVVVELTARKVVVLDGKEKFEPADKALPGDIIEYTASYKNNGKAGVKDVRGKLPIPEGMEYLPGTSTPSNVFASLDGLDFAPMPLKRIVKLPDGREELQDVPYREYRFLQWVLKNLAPGEVAVVRARMKVGTN